MVGQPLSNLICHIVGVRLDGDSKIGGEMENALFANWPAELMAKYTLAPLVRDGRRCLACGDVPKLDWVVLEWVDLYYGGSPWQRITRESDDIFALLENEIFEWPVLERIAGARFRIRLKEEEHVLRITVRPGAGTLANRDRAGLVIEEWLGKRGFMEIVKSDRKSLE